MSKSEGPGVFKITITGEINSHPLASITDRLYEAADRFEYANIEL